jgi:hypothetical protein
MLKTAGKGGLETGACKVFADDMVEIVSFLRATMANILVLKKQGVEHDPAAMAHITVEMCLGRAVDSCLTYISNVLQLIYRCQPGTMKSKEKIEIDWALQFDSIEELIYALAERKVHELSYRSLTDLDDYLMTQHGISLFSEKGHRSRAGQLVGIRNLIVHNRGYVNRIFKERNPESTAALGDRVRYTLPEAINEMGFLIDWIMDLDFRICGKFPVAKQPRTARPKIAPLPETAAPSAV